jgi:uncharacterized protein DUF2721
VDPVLEVITAALTPVVMISTCAVLILGIGNKHTAMSDRLRELTIEFRQPATIAARKSNLRRQMQLFQRRIRHASAAHRWLYSAVTCFVTITPLMIVGRTAVLGPFILALFVSGVLLMLGAVVSELLELRLANRTLEMEMEDVES